MIIDDSEPWRGYICSRLPEEQYLVVGEASDGLEGVRKVEESQPDLILLDIGLPALNGIEAARRILDVSPATKILFASVDRSRDTVDRALHTGANGYLLKSRAATELLPAIEAVLEGRRFLSNDLAGR